MIAARLPARRACRSKSLNRGRFEGGEFGIQSKNGNGGKMTKKANNQYEIHQLIRDRWSPRAFTDRPVAKETMLSLLEAARWAPSCFNEQPWRFIIAHREDQDRFQRIRECLMPGNQDWAEKASVLMISVASKTFARNGNENRYGWHDVGLATSMMAIQAIAMGLYIHPMAGFSGEKAIELLDIPEGCEPVCAIAAGYLGDPATLSEQMNQAETAPSQRNSVSQFAFTGRWGDVYEEKEEESR
jgi:nitroreductase